MDIVSRLKQYIQFKQIPVTQFADTCEIPRPSMSQLLNGRNKKVSDELIRKIHSAYPDLSVMWLMFGEGSMLNISTDSKPSPPPSPVKKSTAPTFRPSELSSTTSSSIDEIFGTLGSISFDIPNAEHQKNDETIFDETDNADNDEGEESTPIKDTGENVSNFNNESPTKRIVSIIIYYSDNSFESFGPIGNH